MGWPRRGILIRLAIYVPIISVLAWRASGGCGEPEPAADPGKDDLEQKLAPHRRVITLPDGRQQDIVELTPAEAEAILGHPIPDRLDEADAKADAKVDAKADAKAPPPEGDAGSSAEAKASLSDGDAGSAPAPASDDAPEVSGSAGAEASAK